MEVQLNAEQLKALIKEEVSEVTDYAWCCEARQLLASFKDRAGNPVQVQLLVTQEDDQFFDVSDEYNYPVTLQE